MTLAEVNPVGAMTNRMTSDIPPGWDYNPSMWRERGPDRGLNALEGERLRESE